MAVALTKNNGDVKVYEQVHERLLRFRADCPINDGWGIVTDIITTEGNKVVFVAKIFDPKGNEVARGHAEEDRNASEINRTSAVENGETSAVGRALFMAGYGNGEICSAEELANAINAQGALKGAKAKAQPQQTDSSPEDGNNVVPMSKGSAKKVQPAAKSDQTPSSDEGGLNADVVKAMKAIGMEPLNVDCKYWFKDGVLYIKGNIPAFPRNSAPMVMALNGKEPQKSAIGARKSTND